MRTNNVFVFAVCICLTLSCVFAQDVADNWNDYLHYTVIGRLDLAKEYAQAMLEADPEPTKVLELYESNPQAAILLQKASETPHDAEFAQIAKDILAMIEEGRYIRRTDAKIIVEEVRRLSVSDRGRLAGLKRLRNAGEYAIPYMVDALLDPVRSDEKANILWALPQIGKDAIRPMTTALQAEKTSLRTELVRALGDIGYPSSLGYLKYVVENDESIEVKTIAEESIRKIDAGAMDIPAAVLFYSLADNYYNHVDSLSPLLKAEYASIWFWDDANQQLVPQRVSMDYFYELMAMRCCEWALKADPTYGESIGLWLASFFKAEANGFNADAAGFAIDGYFGVGHGDAFVYATTAGPEYLHQALARAMNDNHTFVALGATEALIETAGVNSLLFQHGISQPLLDGLRSQDKRVKYSAAIAIALASPLMEFNGSHLVVENLSEALAESSDNEALANKWNETAYAIRAAKALKHLGITRNTILDLAPSQDALLEGCRGEWVDLKVLSAEALVYLNTADAQQVIAMQALKDTNLKSVRIAMFGSLSESAKINGSHIEQSAIDAIYKIVSDNQADADLRNAAAAAFGSLNLPSTNVKNLILDQAKN